MKQSEDLEKLVEICETSFKDNDIYSRTFKEEIKKELVKKYNYVSANQEEINEFDSEIKAYQTVIDSMWRFSKFQINEKRDSIGQKVGIDLYNKITSTSRTKAREEVKYMNEKKKELTEDLNSVLVQYANQSNLDINTAFEKGVERRINLLKNIKNIDKKIFGSRKIDIKARTAHMLNLNAEKAIKAAEYANQLGFKGDKAYKFIMQSRNMFENDLDFIYKIKVANPEKLSYDNLIELMRDKNFEFYTKREIAETYFSNPKNQAKIMMQPSEIVNQIPTAYEELSKDPNTFRNFYAAKFRSEAESFDLLPEDKKYGALVVKARLLSAEIGDEQFLNEAGYPGKLKIPHEKRSRSPAFGIFQKD